MELIDFVGNAGFAVAAAAATVAGFKRGFVGVGSGMLMAPVFAIIFGALETVGMIIMLDAVVTAQLMPSVLRLVEWRVIIPMGAMAAFCMPVGTWLLLTVDPRSMARAIAAVAMVFVLLLPLFAGGAWLGARYFYRSTDRRYRQVALGLLFCVAIYGILR